MYDDTRNPEFTTDEKLHVVAVCSNPVPYASRYRLFRKFVAEMLATPNVNLVIVEHAFGDRPFVVTEAGNPNHVQLRGDERHELWLKESLARKGVERFPSDWKHAALIDGDISFIRPDWAARTIRALEHHAVVQPWSHSIDIGPNGETLANEWGNEVDKSFAAAWVDGDFGVIREGYGHEARAHRSHFGYAWAIRRDAYDGIGGFINWLVTGSADYHMCLGFAGILRDVIKLHKMTPGYRRRLEVFHDRCAQHIKRNIGCVPGTIVHGWHGRKKQRGYISRHEIILASQFDPDLHLVDDWQGLPVLCGNNHVLRDGLRRYFRSRNEDSVDVK